MAEVSHRPAYYAVGGRGWRAWWTLLHPPYTLWHLSYVTIGASLAPIVEMERLVATLLAFLLAMGVGAHALDEFNGRPLQTRIPTAALIAAAAASVTAAIAIGVVMLVRVDPSPGFVLAAVVAIAVGVILVTGYNLHWFGGLLHNDVGFAAAWGAFPVIVAYCAQTAQLHPPAIAAALAAFAMSYAQRSLSTAARFVRRRTSQVELTATLVDGGSRRFGSRQVLAPLEVALKAMVWGHVALAVAMLTATFHT